MFLRLTEKFIATGQLMPDRIHKLEKINELYRFLKSGKMGHLALPNTAW